jgi:hypothetical protein
MLLPLQKVCGPKFLQQFPLCMQVSSRGTTRIVKTQYFPERQPLQMCSAASQGACLFSAQRPSTK